MHFSQMSKASTQRVTPRIGTLYPFCRRFARGKCTLWVIIRAFMVDMHRVGFLGLHGVLFSNKLNWRKTYEKQLF